MKSGAIDSPKMKRLSRALGISRSHAAGIMECLWHFVSVQCPRGDIGRFQNEDIAEAVFWDSDANTLVDALVECRWLDKSDEFRLGIHDWADHADDAVNMRLARRRLVFWCGKSPSSRRLSKDERLKLSQPDDDFVRTESAQKAHVERTASHEMRMPCAPPKPKPEPKPEPKPDIKNTMPEKKLRAANGWFDECWSVYPKKVGKDAAQRAFKSKVDSRETVDAILKALAWQSDSEDWTKDGRKFVPHFATYLNQGRWKDEAPEDAGGQTFNVTQDVLDAAFNDDGPDFWSTPPAAEG